MRVEGWKGTCGRKAETRREETHAVGEKLRRVYVDKDEMW